MATQRAASANARTRHVKSSSQHLQLPEPVVEQIQARLRRVEGQVQAIQRMISERRDCHAVAQQMAAARSAIDRATVQLMTSSMAQCLRPNGSVDEQELARLTDTFVKLL